MNQRWELRELLRRIDQVRREVGRLDPDFSPYHPPNPPATPEEVEKLEEHFRTRLPGEFKALLLYCNGWNHLVAGMDLLSVNDMLDDVGRELIEFDIKEFGTPWIEGVDFRRVIPFGFGMHQADGRDMFLLHVRSPEDYEVFWWRFYLVGKKERSMYQFMKRIFFLLWDQAQTE